MSELRWILLLVGALLVIGVYAYTRWQQKRGPRGGMDPIDRQEEAGEWLEPRLDGEESPTDAQLPEFEELPFDGDEAVDLPDDHDAFDMESWVSASGDGESEVSGQEQKIVVLHVMAPENATFPAAAVVEALKSAGLKYGKYRIFHKETPVGGKALTVFSAADMMEPGTFDLGRLEESWLIGVSFFLVLPGPRTGVDAFADMLATARQVAETLGGEVKDSSRSTLTRQTAHHLREEIISFELHRQHPAG